MKKLPAVSLFSLLIYLPCGAQNKAGIYLTTSDYLNHKLSYETDCAKVKHGIRLHKLPFGRPYISLIYNGQKYRFRKDDLYGYCDCNDKSYRFYANEEYYISDTGQAYIYTQEEYISQYKQRSKTIYRHYFSKGPEGEIFPLSKSKLKEALK